MRPLLIVIALAGTATLGGCALIAAPVFEEQRNAAVEAQARSDLANAAIAAESYAVSNMGAYPTDSEGLIENGYIPSEGMSDVRILVGDAGTSYCLSVTVESGDVFKLFGVVLESGVGECTAADANS
jgi:type IV pilus assembly protein PilA